MANSYLLLPAIAMAMVDGIENKMDPGTPIEKDVYELPPDELRRLPTIPRSLDARLEALDKGREFLLAGGVFNNEIIDGFIKLAASEAAEVERWPSPREFKIYSGWG